MKERPILFTGDMVRAILDGRKTQTRRVMKKQPLNPVGPDYDGLWSDTIDPVTRYFGCPQGQPGDRLWVRETWQAAEWYQDHWEPSKLKYHANATVYRKYRATEDIGECPWRPCIFMPRWASRITLELTGVRVQRVQEISEEDAKAEGIYFSEYGLWTWSDRVMGAANPTFAYQALWNEINVKRGFGWEKNPWVWVEEFRRVKP